MPSIQNTLYRINEAHKADNISMARDAFKDWQACNCLHPKTVNIYDCHSQSYRDIQVACGTCYHCMESKINEWVTRMYAHLEDFKHVYFITLTYRSITTINEPERLMLQKLSQAVWHYDNYNINHHKSYNPCLLVKKHYQDFIKRLRKNTGLTDITYVLCGESGKRYARPHFHAIVFSNSEITRADFVRAWSICLWRDNSGHWSQRRNQRNNGVAYNFPIGRVDYNDLVTNGTLNTSVKVKIDGNMYDASQCFAYVCKYVCKRDTPNKWRMNIAYHNLTKSVHFTRIYYSKQAYLTAIDECQKSGYKILESREEHFKRFQFLLRYEKKVFQPSSDVFSDYLRFDKSVSMYGVSSKTSYYPIKYADFLTEFAPFVEFSRGTPIGSVYATRHLQEFTEGVFKQPLLQTRSFVVPRYFRVKASNHLYPLRSVRRTKSGKSCYLGGLYDLSRLLDSDSPVSTLQLPIFPRWRSSQTYDSLLRSGDYCYRNVDTGESIIFSNGRALHFKYDKHQRKYYLSRHIPFTDFLSSWLALLSDDYKRWSLRMSVSRSNASMLERSQLIASDLGLDWLSMRDTFESDQRNYLSHKQRDYDELHNFVE